MTDLITLVSSSGAAVVFFSTLAARIGAPVPAAPFLIVAGGLSASGQVSLLAAALAALAGSLIGDGLWYLAGRRWGHRVMWLLCRVSLSADSCVRRSELFIARWGGGSLVAARFVPGISLVAPPMAGALGMSVRRFLAFASLGALLWATVLLGLGRVFHAQVQTVLQLLADFGLIATVAAVAVFGLFLGWRYLQRWLALRKEGVRRIDVATLRGAMAADTPITVIDVRSPDVLAIDPRRIPGALTIDLRRLPRAIAGLPAEPDIVVFCDCPDDASARSAARTLMGAGRARVQVLEGGLSAWCAHTDAADADDAALPPEPALAA